MNILEFDAQIQSEAKIFCDHLHAEILLLGGRLQLLTNETIEAGSPRHLVLASLNEAIGTVLQALEQFKDIKAT